MNTETSKEPSSRSGSSSMTRPRDLQLLPSPGKSLYYKLLAVSQGSGIECHGTLQGRAVFSGNTVSNNYSQLFWQRLNMPDASDCKAPYVRLHVPGLCHLAKGEDTAGSVQH